MDIGTIGFVALLVITGAIMLKNRRAKPRQAEAPPSQGQNFQINPARSLVGAAAAVWRQAGDGSQVIISVTAKGRSATWISREDADARQIEQMSERLQDIAQSIRAQER